MRYEHLFSDHLMHSCLPPRCQRAIRAVRQALRNEAVFPQTVALPKALEMMAQAFADLPPEIIARAAEEIRDLAGIWTFHPSYAIPNGYNHLKEISGEISMLEAFPTLAVLYLFHGDGHLRQAALHRLTPAMLSPFVFAALTTRLNDWVRPVRQEAAACMARIISPEALTIVAPAIPHLCGQTASWRRWGKDSATYGRIEASPEVAAYMAQHLRTSVQGPLPRQCRAMLPHKAFDAHLPDLARAAATPNVQAIALGALLKQEAGWITGWEKHWVDKSYGISRRDPVWTHRPIAVPVDTPAMVLFGANSRFVVVRRTVAYWLLTTAEPYPEAVALLSQDKYPSIRNAMDFYQRKQAENA